MFFQGPRHSDPPCSSIANGSDDAMTGVIHKPCNSADHDYSINDHTTAVNRAYNIDNLL